jgi:hypothetical protein
MNDVLIYKDGSYWITEPVFQRLQGGADDHNEHLIGYRIAEGVNGFEIPGEAYGYLAYLGDKKRISDVAKTVIDGHKFGGDLSSPLGDKK